MIYLTQDGPRVSNNIEPRVRYYIEVDRHGKIINKEYVHAKVRAKQSFKIKD